MTRAMTIFKKELTDSLRDKRTIITMLVVPLLVIPLALGIVAKVGQRMSRQANARTSSVAFIGQEHAPELFRLLELDTLVAVQTDVEVAELEELIRSDSLDGAIVVTERFLEFINTDQQARVDMYYKSTDQFNVVRQRMTAAVDQYDEQIVSGRVRRLGLDENLFDAIAVDRRDISSLKEQLGKTVGGFIPYIFILMCYTGAMYPGLDLGAGEKERGTLETILSSPAGRLDIAFGKFGVITLFGLTSALFGIGGLYLGVRSVGEIPQEILDVIWDILNLQVMGLLGALLLPLAVFFGAMILAFSINAKSYKEGQSALTPLTMLIILPAVVGTLPGVELSAKTAMIPILNVSLATKDVIAGTLDPALMALTFGSLVAFAVAALWFCVWRFNQESVLFRS